jgi:hypothetical protein
MRKWLLVGVFAASVLRPGIAAADALQFTGTGRGSAVTIGGLEPGTFFAGELNWNWMTAPGSGFIGSLYTYCVDLVDTVISTQAVTVLPSSSLSSSTSPYTTAGGGGRAAWLINSFAADIHNNTNVTTANYQAAGLQLAIWETLYDFSVASPFNLASGNFFVSSANSSVVNFAVSYLTQLGTTHTGTALYFDSPAGPAFGAGQDQMTQQVPEPATVLTMAMALGLMFMFRRRLVPGYQSQSF